ncbi:hypothetical protein Tco_0394496 [Tanacetum coccineum]
MSAKGGEGDRVSNWTSSEVIGERVRVMSIDAFSGVRGGGETLGGGDSIKDEEVSLVDGVLDGALEALETIEAIVSKETLDIVGFVVGLINNTTFMNIAVFNSYQLEVMLVNALRRFRESLRRVTDGAEAFLILTLLRSTKLKKQAQPVIKHFKAYLKTVSLQKRIPKKSSSKKQRMHKKNVSKQGRKIAKGESTVQRDPMRELRQTKFLAEEASSQEIEHSLKKKEMNKKDSSKGEEIKQESKEEVKKEKDEEGTRKRKLGTRKKMKSRKRRYIQNTSEDDSD